MNYPLEKEFRINCLEEIRGRFFTTKTMLLKNYDIFEEESKFLINIENFRKNKNNRYRSIVTNYGYFTFVSYRITIGRFPLSIGKQPRRKSIKTKSTLIR